MNTKRCYACGETKPITEFPRNSKAHSGRNSKCRGCTRYYRGHRGGYVDPDVSAATPELSSEQMVAFWGLAPQHVELVDGAVQRIRAHTDFAMDRDTEGQWEGDTAEDYVNREMPDATTTERTRVLQVAIAKAKEDGVEPGANRYERGAA